MRFYNLAPRIHRGGEEQMIGSCLSSTSDGCFGTQMSPGWASPRSHYYLSHIRMLVNLILHTTNSQCYDSNNFFFLEYEGELRIIVLKREETAPYNLHHLIPGRAMRG